MGNWKDRCERHSLRRDNDLGSEASVDANNERAPTAGKGNRGGDRKAEPEMNGRRGNAKEEEGRPVKAKNSEGGQEE